MNLTISWINSNGEPLILKTIRGLNLGDTVNVSPIIPEITLRQGDLTIPGIEKTLQVDFAKEVFGIQIKIEDEEQNQP